MRFLLWSEILLYPGRPTGFVLFSSEVHLVFAKETDSVYFKLLDVFGETFKTNQWIQNENNFII